MASSNRYCSNDHTEQINYYSGPNTFDSDGTRTGDRLHDNVQLLNAMRYGFAGIGNEAEACPKDPNIIVNETKSSQSQPPSNCSATQPSTRTEQESST